MADQPATFCDCDDRPTHARGRMILDHPGGCEFPGGRCTNDDHRRTVHEKCGRPVETLFCACMPSGYTHDIERDWWVHYWCGWPTRVWFEAAGKPAPERLRGLKPVTFHEFVIVPKSPKSVYDRLTDEQRTLNDRLPAPRSGTDAQSISTPITRQKAGSAILRVP